MVGHIEIVMKLEKTPRDRNPSTEPWPEAKSGRESA